MLKKPKHTVSECVLASLYVPYLYWYRYWYWCFSCCCYWWQSQQRCWWWWWCLFSSTSASSISHSCQINRGEFVPPPAISTEADSVSFRDVHIYSCITVFYCWLLLLLLPLLLLLLLLLAFFQFSWNRILLNVSCNTVYSISLDQFTATHYILSKKKRTKIIMIFRLAPTWQLTFILSVYGLFVHIAHAHLHSPSTKLYSFSLSVHACVHLNELAHTHCNLRHQHFWPSSTNEYYDSNKNCTLL